MDESKKNPEKTTEDSVNVSSDNPDYYNTPAGYIELTARESDEGAAMST